VGGEVVHGDLHALALLEFAQRVGQQVEVEGVRVVEVVVVAGGQSLLIRGQHLQGSARTLSFMLLTGLSHNIKNNDNNNDSHN